MKEFTTTGTVDRIEFKLDGRLFRAYKPNESVLLTLVDAIDQMGANGVDVENGKVDTRENLKAARATGVLVDAVLDMLPKVFDKPDADHLRKRYDDPKDLFDLMGGEDHPGVLPILMHISGLGKDDGEAPAPKTSSASRAGSPRRTKASTVTSRAKASASKTSTAKAG